jgi:hypothetical protein
MNSRIPFKKGLIALTILFVMSTVLLAGCLGTSDLTPSTSTSGSGSSGSNYAPLAAPGLSSDSSKSSYVAPMATSTASETNVYSNVNDRKVIMTASVVLETSEHDKVVGTIRSIASSAGGYIQSSSTWLSDQDKKTTSISVKVPVAQYESSLAQIKALGKIKSESSSGQDVTRQYIDLSARLKNLQAEEKQLSDMMSWSKNVSEVLMVEKELFRVRGDIESTQAQLNYLGSQVDFSTITVTVTEPQPVVGYDWGLDTAIKNAIRGFIGMIGALIVITGYLIPLALYLVIVLAVAYLVLRWAWRFYNNWKKNKEIKESKPK